MRAASADEIEDRSPHGIAALFYIKKRKALMGLVFYEPVEYLIEILGYVGVLFQYYGDACVC